MLRKMILLMMFAMFMLTLSSCEDSTKMKTDTSVSEQTSGAVDIDLTSMSSTMVYSQVYDMMLNPSDYAGDTIKLVGTFYSEYYDVTDTTYNFVIINDATGCCPQGIEFISTSGDEYPEQGAAIEMIGVFDIYDEGNNQYYRITTDEVTLQQTT